MVARSVCVPRLDRSQVCGAASKHVISRVNEDLANQVQGLLGAVGQQDVARCCWDTILVHRSSQVFFEGLVSLGGAVLHSPGPVFADDVAAGFFDLA